MPPRNTNANAALLTHLAITSPKECLELKKALDRVTDLVFYLPPDERDYVVQHMTKHRFTEFYYGRLALRAIAIDNKWWNEEQYWRNVQERADRNKVSWQQSGRDRFGSAFLMLYFDFLTIAEVCSMDIDFEVSPGLIPTSGYWILPLRHVTRFSQEQKRYFIFK